MIDITDPTEIPDIHSGTNDLMWPGRPVWILLVLNVMLTSVVIGVGNEGVMCEACLACMKRAWTVDGSVEHFITAGIHCLLCVQTVMIPRLTTLQFMYLT